jgi:hypothetical protein
VERSGIMSGESIGMRRGSNGWVDVRKEVKNLQDEIMNTDTELRWKSEFI